MCLFFHVNAYGYIAVPSLLDPLQVGWAEPGHESPDVQNHLAYECKIIFNILIFMIIAK